jgi:uncharacterized membrane protein
MNFKWVRNGVAFLITSIAVFYLHRLSLDYFFIRFSDLGLAHYCGQSAIFSCSKTLLSSFSSLSLGAVFPVSEIGIFYFLFLFFCFLSAELVWLTRVLSLMGFLVSLVYLGLMAGVLKSFCFPCLMAHSANLVLGLVIWRKGSEQKKRSQKSIPLFFGLVTLVLGLAIFYDFQLIQPLRAKVSQGRAAEFIEIATLKSPNAERYWRELQDRSTPFRGEQGVEVFVFFDFHCPYCSESLRTFDEWNKTHAGQIRLRVIPFPLERECNPAYAGSDYSGSCQLQEVFYCLKRENLLETSLSDLLAGAESVFHSKETLREIHWSGSGVSERVNACLTRDREWVKQQRESDFTLAVRLGVTGTPAFFYAKSSGQGSPRLFKFLGAISVGGWEKLNQ